MRIVKKILFWILHCCVRLVLRKYHPRIIAITGSVGKTSTREALFAGLSGNFRVRQSAKNYNTETGVPATVLGVTAPGRNPLLWFFALLKTARLLLLPSRYPELLIVEFGMDKPGDIEYLMNMTRPEVGILTRIGDLTPVHSAFFNSIDALIAEKGKIVTMLNREGLGIVNADDKRSLAAVSSARAKVIKVGSASNANVRVKSIFEKYSLKVAGRNVEGGGAHFTVHIEAQEVTVHLRNLLGEHYGMMVGQVLAAGKYLNVPMEEMVKRLEVLENAPGRLRLLLGIKKSILLDDSYNASPIATRVALDVFKKLEYKSHARKVVVLGHLAELDKKEESVAHEQVAAEVAEVADFFVGVGKGIAEYEKGATSAGMSAKAMQFFQTSEQAAEYMVNALRNNDLVLIKGSQSARMEKVTKMLMAEPDRAAELLVRQSREWTREKL